LLNEVL
jgi:hypothetical protein